MISSLLTPLVRGLIEVGGAIAPTPLPSAYVANGFEPDYVADFSATSADYFRVAGSDSDFATAFTSDSEGGGLATMTDSSGNLVRRPHNQARGSQSIGDATWTASNVTTTQNAAVAPDGTTTASNIVPTGSGVSHYEFQSGPDAEINLGKVARVFVKANGYGYFQIATGNSGDGYVNINLSSGAVTDSGRMSGSATAYGNGWYLLEATGFINDDVFLCPRPDDGAKLATFDADGSSGVLAWGYHLTREDLGGMANNPDAAAGFETYVPTTTAARYLLRRRHHYWTGSAWAPTLLHEPVGATNELLDSRDWTTGNWTAAVAAASTARDAVGIDGQANTATTLTDGDGSLRNKQQIVTLAAATNDVCLFGFVQKTTGASTFPGVLVAWGANGNFNMDIDTDNGTLAARSGSGSPFTDSGVINWSADYWLVYFVENNANSVTSYDFRLYPAATTNPGVAAWSAGNTGSAIVDAWHVIDGASVPSSPIITTGASVTRSADTCKVKAAALPYDSTAMSFAVKGRGNFPDTKDERIFAWTDGSKQRIEFYRARSAGDVLRFAVNTSGSTVNADSASAIVSGAGANVAFRIAGRVNFDANQQQVALDGTAGTQVANTNTVPLVSTGDAGVGQYIPNSIFNLPAGEFDAITGFAADIAEAGIEEALA